MPNPQLQTFMEMVEQILPSSQNLDSALQKAKKQVESWLPDAITDEIYDEARSTLAKQLEDIEVLKVISIIKKRPPWYMGSKPTDLHWPALKGYLKGDKGWHSEDVQSIDETSDEVVSLLNNPKEESFTCRGLVVGHVQSGKTANMTAVMAKAIDAGYNTIIVLAGLTNKLRQQTQTRIMDDLVRRHPLNWQVLTSEEETKDFKKPPSGGFLSHPDKAQIAVVKKNVSPLKQLLEAIDETHPLALSKLRVLIIDDECDQASVNSATGETDMTSINERIRQLIKLFPAITYVGYTATPFANVFINPYKPDGTGLDDLYPADFISSLPTPPRYFGAEKLFGKPPIDSDGESEGDDGLDMIRYIPDEESKSLQPAKAKERDTFQPRMPESLENAILYFIASCAVRRVRGQTNKHMSMLVHTSAYVAMHEKLAALIRGWLETRDLELRSNDSPLMKKLVSLWTDEKLRVPEDITDSYQVSFSELMGQIPKVLDAIEVPIENGASDDRINYSSPPKTYIVVGGSVLARGLTIEGLMVSYFLRSASQYDTLLQMGRWFGYRPGYEDIPRIWTSEDLALRFRALAGIEAEIREEIEEYRARDVTPMELAVRVRSIPGMAITASAKMKSTIPSAISYWGTHRQTFRFYHKDDAIISRNWQAGSDLVSHAENLGLRDMKSKVFLWREVPRSVICHFLSNYTPHADHKDLAPQTLIDFIDGGGEKLKFWNVGLVGSQKAPKSEEDLGVIGPVPTVNRAKLDAGSSNKDADIKALMSKSDLTVDNNVVLEKDSKWADLKIGREKELGDKPLLLLYAIDRNSSPRQKPSKSRSNLEADGDLLGYGIVFPGSKVSSGKYFSVSLEGISADDIEEIEAEERAQAEAARV